MRRILALGFCFTLLAACGTPSEELTSNSTTNALRPNEDCVALNYHTAQVRYLNGRFKIVDGSHVAFDFGASRAEADKALAILRAYKIKHSCFVGRPEPSLEYLLNERGLAPVGNLVASEDCILFNNDLAQVKWIVASRSWKIVEGGKWLLDFGTKQHEANEALRLIKRYKFNQQCFVGRPHPSLKYWKRKIILPLSGRVLED